MKRLFTILMMLSCSLLGFAQFTGIITDEQGVQYVNDNGIETCHVCGHAENYSAEIVIPETIEGRRVTSIGQYAFRDCTDLTSITIPSSVTEIGPEAFRGCTVLTQLSIPSSVTAIGREAFIGCSGLTSVTLSAGLEKIAQEMFSECSALTGESGEPSPGHK